MRGTGYGIERRVGQKCWASDGRDERREKKAEPHLVLDAGPPIPATRVNRNHRRLPPRAGRPRDVQDRQLPTRRRLGALETSSLATAQLTSLLVVQNICMKNRSDPNTRQQRSTQRGKVS